MNLIPVILILLSLAASACFGQTNQPRNKAASSTPTAPNATEEQQREAHEAIMRFLQGIKLAALPEGKQLLAETQWVLGQADRGQNFYSRPDYTSVSSLFASLFDTDTPPIKGYKELFEMSAVSQGGTTRNLKFLAVAFQDRATGKWKVLGTNDNANAESTIDIEQQVAYFQNRLADTRITSAQENYANYAHWLLLSGRISEARSALNSATTASTRTSLDDHADPIRELQIKTMLEIIEKIT